MRDSIEDLSALSRRGELDSAERRRLQLALQSSSEARLLHRAGLDLDLAGAMLPGDDALRANAATATSLLFRPPLPGSPIALGLCYETARRSTVGRLELAGSDT